MEQAEETYRLELKKYVDLAVHKPSLGCDVDVSTGVKSKPNLSDDTFGTWQPRIFALLRQVLPQGALMKVREQEDRKSKGCFVMKQIE